LPLKHTLYINKREKNALVSCFITFQGAWNCSY